MSEPTTRELLSCNPLASAAYDYAMAGETLRAWRGRQNQQRYEAAEQRLRLLLLADVAPDPTTLLHLADELTDHARTYRAAIVALGCADVPMERAEHEGRRDRALAGMRAAITSGGSDV